MLFRSDVAEAQTYLNSRYFRPPHGRIGPKQHKTLKTQYTIVMWDLITRDYNQKLSPEQILNKVKRYCRNGSIIVFHDSEKAAKNMLGALEPSIKWIKAQGYEFKLLEQ